MKVVLFGDSIRLIGYGPLVSDILKDKGYDVFQPEDNCRFCKYTLRLIFELDQYIRDADIIHFNVGLWDVCSINKDGKAFSSLEEYKENLRRIAELFLDITPHVIFATTTPVRKENPYNRNEVIDKYNEVAVGIMKELGIKINDLNSLFKNDIEKYIRADDLIHLTEEGAELAAKQVADIIEEEANSI